MSAYESDGGGSLFLLLLYVCMRASSKQASKRAVSAAAEYKINKCGSRNYIKSKKVQARGTKTAPPLSI